MKELWSGLTPKTKETIIWSLLLLGVVIFATLAGLHERGTYHVGGELILLIFGIVLIVINHKKT